METQRYAAVLLHLKDVVMIDLNEVIFVFLQLCDPNYPLRALSVAKVVTNDAKLCVIS